MPVVECQRGRSLVSSIQPTLGRGMKLLPRWDLADRIVLHGLDRRERRRCCCCSGCPTCRRAVAVGSSSRVRRGRPSRRSPAPRRRRRYLFLCCFDFNAHRQFRSAGQSRATARERVTAACPRIVFFFAAEAAHACPRRGQLGEGAGACAGEEEQRVMQRDRVRVLRAGRDVPRRGCVQVLTR